MALDGNSSSNFTASYLGNNASSKKYGNAKIACFEAVKRMIELCSMAKIARVKWKAINIALGQYWFLLLLHGFIPPGAGQYGVLLPWLEEVT